VPALFFPASSRSSSTNVTMNPLPNRKTRKPKVVIITQRPSSQKRWNCAAISINSSRYIASADVHSTTDRLRPGAWNETHSQPKASTAPAPIATIA